MTSSSFNQKNLPVLGQNPKLHWQSTKSVVTAKKQTRQTNLMPAFNYFISWNIGTVGYKVITCIVKISLYKNQPMLSQTT